MAIVRNIQNNNLYRYLGGNTYRNIMTGVEGEIDEAVASRIFKINLELTDLCENFPNIEIMINKLKLKSDKNGTDN
jgi:hypothetical protein|tara:strand:+ start:546 stop:773 length:228 start_codon:yes stop_codon:yes gene_type:complete